MTVMTDPNQIASSLSEAQRVEFAKDRKGINWPMWLKVQRPDLLEYHENSFGSWINLTPLGEAVRAIIERDSNGK